MNTDFMKGVVVPILTVIDEEEKIDEAGQRAQVDYVIAGGVSGILAFGSNGEFYMVEEDEMERGLKIMVDQAAGRVPVYFGIGAINTKKCCRLAQMAVKNGAAAVSVLQPMVLKPTYTELLQHFQTIARSVPETPVLLYNNPGRVGYTLTAQLVNRGMRLFSLSFLFAGYNIFASALFTALSDGRTSALISFARTFFFILVGIWLMTTLLGLDGLWLAIPFAELVTAGLSFYMIRTRFLADAQKMDE